MVAIDMFTADTKQAARTRYDERQRNEQKHRRMRKSTNRAISLDNRSSANGVSTGRAQRRVLTDGSAALVCEVDDYSFTVSEEMYALFVSEAGQMRDYATDARNAPTLEAGAYRVRLAGEIHYVSISAPYLVMGRWHAVMTFDDMPGNIKFAVTLAQLAKVLDIAPALSIVEKQAPTPVWEPSASALRWTACMCAAAEALAEQDKTNGVYDLTTCDAALVDTSGLFRVVAGYVVEI